MTDTPALVKALPTIEARLAALSAEQGLEVVPTGYVKLIAELERRIVQSQVESFGAAFGLVTLLLALLLGPRLGALALIPNLAPVAVGLGFMGAAGVALDPGTAMVASLTLGLVVDDTVHLLTHLRGARADDEPLSAALERTVKTVGRALLLTSALLVAGFGALGFGHFRPNIAFGAIASVVVAAALLADLVVLPALLVLARRVAR